MSIVIPTYHRKEKLGRLLSSIAETPPELEYEIMIVDDSKPPTVIDAEMLDAFAGRLGVIHNPHRVFYARARNLGWRRALGEYVFFLDDDNILPGGTVSRLVAKLELDSKIGAIMPVVYYAKRRNLVWVYATPFDRGRWHFDLVGRNTIERIRPASELLPTDALPNAFIVRRGLLQQTGGFDERLPMGNSADFCQRIKQAGYGVYALTTAATYHDVELPGTAGFWAEHAGDVERRYFDVKDWFLFTARVHRGESLLLVKLLLRCFDFVIPGLVGALLRSSIRKQSLLSVYGAIFRGVRDGLQEAMLV